jgi:hypothetical protein
MKVQIMLIACSTCSGPSGISRSLGEQVREPHIRFGPVRGNMVVASFQAVVKPAIDGVVTSTLSRRAIRGGWEQRADTDMLGTWEICLGGLLPNGRSRTHKTGLGPDRKSEALIVVPEEERGSGRRGSAVDRQPTRRGDPLG